MTWNNRFEGQWKSSTFSLVLIISNAINFLFSLNESKKELRAVNPSQVLICRGPLLLPICPLDTSHAPGQRVRHNHIIYFFLVTEMLATWSFVLMGNWLKKTTD